MKSKIVGLLAILFGIITISFPILGVISAGEIVGLSVLFISIFSMLVGTDTEEPILRS